MYLDVGNEEDELGDRSKFQMMEGVRDVVRSLLFALRKAFEGLIGGMMCVTKDFIKLLFSAAMRSVGGRRGWQPGAQPAVCLGLGGSNTDGEGWLHSACTSGLIHRPDKRCRGEKGNGIFRF